MISEIFYDEKFLIIRFDEAARLQIVILREIWSDATVRNVGTPCYADRWQRQSGRVKAQNSNTAWRVSSGVV